MRKLAAGLLGICLALSLWLPRAPHAMGYQGVSLLKAEPLYGHVGDPIYLSGTGFLKNQNLVITMICPSLNSPAASNNEEIWGPIGGPRTDSHGTFLDYPIRAIKLTGMKSSVCTIYASNGPNPFGDIPASYQIVTRTQRLPWPATHVTATVLANPTQAHGGQLETVHLGNGWPGAYGTVSLTYGGVTTSRSLRLNASGSGGVRWRLGHVRGSVPAHVSVLLHLGHFKGTGSRRFTVSG